MGVIYRLKPEVVEFIVSKKKEDPNLSCRKFVSLLGEKFGIAVSKSSVNAVIKGEGLSMPIGRRRKKPRRLKPLIQEIPQKEITLLAEPVKPQLPEELPTPQEGPGPSSAPQEAIPLGPGPKEEVIEPQKIDEKIEEPASQEELAQEGPGPLKEEPEKIEEGKKETKEHQEAPIEKPPEKPLQEPVVVPKEQEVKTEIPLIPQTSGTIMLGVLDSLLGGSLAFNDLISHKLNLAPEQLVNKTQNLLHYFILKELGIDYSSMDISSYINDIKGDMILTSEIYQEMLKLFQEGRCAKFNFSDTTNVYLDAQFYTIWSTPHIPYDFSSPLNNIKASLSRAFYQNQPLILFMAPGYDTPTKEFFYFLSAMNASEKILEGFNLYNNKFEELEAKRINDDRKYNFIIGMWPWQFSNCRKIKSSGDYKEIVFGGQGKSFYVSEAEIELTQPSMNQGVKLRGGILKSGINDKARLVVLTNLEMSQAAIEEVALAYLERWPNLEETFQDFSRKVELFTYTVASQYHFSTEKLELTKVRSANLELLFLLYVRALDAYFKWHFLPSGYEEKDLLTTKERFYKLKVELQEEKTRLLVKPEIPTNYTFLKDLQYACRRINEKYALTPNNKIIYLTL